MQLEDIKKLKGQLNKIAAKYGIRKVYVFDSVARGESNETSDVDFLIEMETNTSAPGIGAFQFEAQQLLGVHVDVICQDVGGFIDSSGSLD